MRSSNREGRALTIRLIGFVVISMALMMADQSPYLKVARAYLSELVYPIQYLVNLPVKVGQWLSISVSGRIQLLEENTRLHKQNLLLQVALQKFEDLKSENERLRQLLNSPVKSSERVLVAEVLAVDIAPYDPGAHKIKINKGSHHDVFEGQPVLDAHGVMGQVYQVEAFSSTVMLITDRGHELPVQVVRTGSRTVAKGMGAVNLLSLLYLPNIGINAHLKEGDLVVTSGLGQQFPKGYPVGTVKKVGPDIGKSFAEVLAVPRALLEHNREVLLVWKGEESRL